MKKNIKLILLVFIMFLQCFCFNVKALENTDIFSNEALVVDLSNNEVLFSKNTNDSSVEIASLTKIMTYVLSIENINDLNTKIVVPEGIRDSIISQNGSNANLQDGYEYTALDLLYGLMLPSGCDAADVLAHYVSSIKNEDFISLMNKKAKELGMNNTIFYSASGLSDSNGNNNISTEQDLYLLAKYVIDLPYFKEIIGTEFYDVKGYKNEVTTTTTVRNTNYMMGEYNGAEYFYQYSLGGKTGNTNGAGRCLISYAKKGDLKVVAITLGVPNEHSNYHLTDHKKLFEYVFNTFTPNITVDIGTEYKSVNIGEKIQINAVTSEDTKITWTSSDSSVATVNEYGIVTGIKMGQVKIIATTETGNQDYAYVSVGFYNGIDIKYSAGPSDPNGILGYGKLDWQVFKKYGIDFAIIRAGYATSNIPKSDPYFVDNIKGAVENGINIMISFDSYAKSKEHAKEEAEYLIQYLNENIFEYLDEITLPIVYNLYNCPVTDIDLFKEILITFKEIMETNGYKTVMELGKTKTSTLDLKSITEEEIGLYMIYRPYVPDFNDKMSATNNNEIYDADMWQYRTDAYFGDTGVAKKIIMSIMYMDYLNMDTAHEKHDDSLYSSKEEIKVEGNYQYTGNDILANINGYDEEKMTVEGNIGKDAGTYTITITPKTKWRDGSKDQLSISWVINKSNPKFNVPSIIVEEGTSLNNITLPSNFYWNNSYAKVTKDNNRFLVSYIPNDTKNYNTINFYLTVSVLEAMEDDEIVEEANSNIIEEEKEDIKETNENKNAKLIFNALLLLFLLFICIFISIKIIKNK